jgi:hypothetical protein
MAIIPVFWPLGVPGVMASMDAPRRERTATAVPPGVPLQSPSINRPEPSWRPAGGCPLIWSWTGSVTLNGLIGLTRLTVDLDLATEKMKRHRVRPDTEFGPVPGR